MDNNQVAKQSLTAEPVEVSPEQTNKVNTLLATIEQVRKQVIDLEQKNYELEAQLAANNEPLNKAIEILKANQL